MLAVFPAGGDSAQIGIVYVWVVELATDAHLVAKIILITHKPPPISGTDRAWGLFGRRPSESRDHGREIVSSVEVVFEFGEVARNMLAVDGTIGSCDGGLDVAERGVGPFECRHAGGLWS